MQPCSALRLAVVAWSQWKAVGTETIAAGPIRDVMVVGSVNHQIQTTINWQTQRQQHQVPRIPPFTSLRQHAHPRATRQGEEGAVGLNLDWEPPHIPYVKCNSDAAFFLEGNSVCYGLVIRNAGGRFVSAKAGKLFPLISVLEVEALSIEEALSWMLSLGFLQVIIEMDNSNLFYALIDQDVGMSYFDSIISECKAISRSFI